MERSGQVFRRAIAAASPALLAALLWACASAVAAALSLYNANRFETVHAADITALFFCGGLLGWPLAMMALRFLPASTALPLRFAACCLAIAFFTLAAAAALFALEYRLFYARWHATAFSGTWLLQQIFTALGAIYQFAVLGPRVYLPFAAVPLALASAWLCRRRA